MEYEKALTDLISNELVQYIELYAVPDTFEETGRFWKKFPVPFVIHAPHSAHGLNLSLPEKRDYNLSLFTETRIFADLLDSSRIIVHGGINGSVEELISQISFLNDSRIIIENKPLLGLSGDTCLGADVESIKRITSSCHIDFCLDIGHAIAAANSFKLDPYEYLIQFMTLQPVMIHLADGDETAKMDSHLHLGAGNYNFKKISKLLDQKYDISLETPKDSPTMLDDYKKDREFLSKLF
jgi:deoxyribonuclease IV